MPATDLYLYGIVPADPRPDVSSLPGVGVPPGGLRTVAEAGVAAVVSPAPERLRARRRYLMAHQDALLALAESGPVLPMRFGTVAPDEAALRARLAAGAAEYQATLRSLAGRLEVNLKALPAEAGLAALVREDAGIQRLRAELRRNPGYEANVRLGEAIAAGLERRAEQAAAAAVRDLTPLADAVRPGPKVAGCVANTSFLVRRERLADFGTRVDRWAEEQRERAQFRLTGPLPCYSFVEPQHASATFPTVPAAV